MREVNPEDLRASILQAAIQGKLVPQDPNDEPASVLLERIREEKQRLVKEGKIKKPKHESFIFRRDNHYYENIDGIEKCIDEEIPFIIPESWEWVRLGSLVTKLGSGSTPKGGKQVYKESGIPFIRSQNVYNDGLRLDSVAFIDKEINDLHKGSIVSPKDLLLNITGGSIGRCALVPDIFETANVNQHVMIIRLVCTEIRQYVHLIICSPYFFSKIMDLQVGATKEGLSAESASKMLLPLAPLSEQSRIMKSADRSIGLLNEVSSLYDKAISADLRLKDDLRASIIQYAIQGKLTPQDSKESPIQIHCKNPIIRRDNSYYETINGKEICLDSEMIYDKIPSNWCLVRLSDVIHLVSGRDLRPEQYNDDKLGIPYITGASNIVGGRVIINRWTEEPVSIAEKGDILISCKGTIGSTCILADVEKVHIARQIMAIRVRDIHTRDFILLYLRAMMAEIDSRKHGTIPGISREDLLSLLIAIPPIDEQTRIVNKVNELLSITNQLSD